jgi:hypothetical protein
MLLDDFTFTLTDNVQDQNPGYGVWMTQDRQTAIIQTGETDGKHTTYIPCLRNCNGSLQGVNGYTGEKTFDAAIAQLNGATLTSTEIPSGYMVTSTGDVVLADDWDDIEAAL